MSITFTVFEIAKGRWCARRSDGLVGGTFRDRDGAMRFARRESRMGQPVMLLSSIVR